MINVWEWHTYTPQTLQVSNDCQLLFFSIASNKTCSVQQHPLPLQAVFWFSRILIVEEGVLLGWANLSEVMWENNDLQPLDACGWCVHTPVHSNTPKHSHSNNYRHAHIQAHTHTNTHTYTRTYTHTLTITGTHTHTHTHTYNCMQTLTCAHTILSWVSELHVIEEYLS